MKAITLCILLISLEFHNSVALVFGPRPFRQFRFAVKHFDLRLKIENTLSLESIDLDSPSVINKSDLVEILGFSLPFNSESKNVTNRDQTQYELKLKLIDKPLTCWGLLQLENKLDELRVVNSDKNLSIVDTGVYSLDFADKLSKMNVKVCTTDDLTELSLSDTAIVPTCGASSQLVQSLEKNKVNIIDVNCPWISREWKPEDSKISSEYTTIVHGQYTIDDLPSISPNNRFIIVKDLEEAQILADYIVDGGVRSELVAKFKNAWSKGFDPDLHLDKIACVNRTTVYKKETKEICRLFEFSMLKKFGPSNFEQHYREFSTTCSAVQSLYEELLNLSKNREIDVLLMIGDKLSPITSKLKDIAEENGVVVHSVESSKHFNIIYHKFMEQLGERAIDSNFKPSNIAVKTIGVITTSNDRELIKKLEKLVTLYNNGIISFNNL